MLSKKEDYPTLGRSDVGGWNTEAPVLEERVGEQEKLGLGDKLRSRRKGRMSTRLEG